MNVTIRGTYRAGKRVELLHEPSGTKIVTAAPKDNEGDGSSFSPTDLVAAALGACMLTVMGIVAERGGLSLEGSWFHVEKIMSTTPPRRIARLPLTLHLPASLSPEDRGKLERAAHTCPVHRSLSPECEVQAGFAYDV